LVTSFFENLSTYSLDYNSWLICIVSAMLFGSAKAGIAGAGMLAVPILAHIFGGKSSAGIILPMLSMSDIIAVSYYYKETNWRYVFRILPGTFLGVLVGLFVGSIVSDEMFKLLIAIIVIIISAIVIYKDFIRKTPFNVPDRWYFATSTGLLAGFATMIGNASSPIVSLYLISKNLSKNVFVATTAIYFFIVNLSKIPLHIFVWRTITWQSITLNLALLPAIIIGALLGIFVVKYFPEKIYRNFVIMVTIISAIVLVIDVVR